jgi:hypothetical protein
MASESPRRWCITVVCLTLGAVVAIAATNWTIDFYQLFHPAKGARVSLYSNERMGKYLLSLRYISTNFDGLFIGSSVSQNWPLTRLGELKIYNISLSGANISEEKVMAENVFARRQVKLAVFCIHPYLTMSHGLKSSYMTPQDYWAAFGSLPLFREYAGELLARHGGGAALVDPDGVTFAPHPEQKAGAAAVGGLQVDEEAVAEYVQLVAEAHAQGARVVAFVPPISVAVRQREGAAMQAYVRRMADLFTSTGDVVVDFNSSRYAALWVDAGTFIEDGTHLTDQAAAQFATNLERAIIE